MLEFFKKASNDILYNLFNFNHQSCIVEYIYDHTNDIARTINKNTLQPFFAFASPYTQMAIHRILFSYFLNVPYFRHIVPFKDGTECVLDIAEPKQKGENILFVCHGLGGNSTSCYCKKFASEGLKHGFTVVIYNRRGHIANNNSTSKPYPLHYDPEDMDIAVNAVKHMYPNYKHFYGVGFSIGSNLLLKYAGQKISNPFNALVSISNAIFFKNGVDHFENTNNDANLFAVEFINDILQHHPKLYNDPVVMNKLKSCKSFKQMDSFITKYVYGQNFDMDTYYDTCSCHDVIESINVPIFAIASKDDPFLPTQQINNIYKDIVKRNPKNALCILTSHGGHVGWLHGFKCEPWLYNNVFEFLYLCSKNRTI